MGVGVAVGREVGVGDGVGVAVGVAVGGVRRGNWRGELHASAATVRIRISPAGVRRRFLGLFIKRIFQIGGLTGLLDYIR